MPMPKLVSARFICSNMETSDARRETQENSISP